MASDAMKKVCPDLIRGRNPKATLVTPGENNDYNFQYLFELVEDDQTNIPLVQLDPISKWLSLRITC